MPHHKKRSYATRRLAIAACLRASKRTGMPLRVYFCQEHRAYHLTKERR